MYDMLKSFTQLGVNNIYENLLFHQFLALVSIGNTNQ